MTRKHTTTIVVHCSATKSSQDIGAAEIGHWHKARGFNCIGYHYVIRRDGMIEKGRDIDAVGAHCKAAGLNHESIGICLVGGINSSGVAEANFTFKQYKTLSKLIDDVMVRFPEISKVIGHRDVDSHKACPSFDVSSFMAG